MCGGGRGLIISSTCKKLKSYLCRYAIFFIFILFFRGTVLTVCPEWTENENLANASLKQRKSYRCLKRLSLCKVQARALSAVTTRT